MAQLLTNPRTQQKQLLSLNIQSVSDLFPGFAPGDFAIIHGSSIPIAKLTSLLCIRAQLPPQLGGLSSNVVFIDGAETLNANNVPLLAEIVKFDSKKALDKLYLFKAFTAYQMTSFILDRLNEVVERYNSQVVIINDLAGLLLENDIEPEEAARVFNLITSYLQHLAKEKQIIVIATFPPRKNDPHKLALQNIACNKANVVIAVTQTTYDREFELEKHPQFMLGTAELPSDNLPLTDFL
jgi:hypothetical protein